MVSALSGYYRPSSAKTLVLTKAGDQIPDSWGYVGPNNVEGWPVTVFLSPQTSAPPTISNSSASGTTAVPTSSPSPNVADGSIYVTGNGTYYQSSNSGFGVPDSWQKVTTVPDGTSLVTDPMAGLGITTAGEVPRFSTGGVYLLPNGNYIQPPVGQAIPSTWIDTAAANIDTTGKNITVVPDPMASYNSARFVQIITSILTIGGIGYLGYLGYRVYQDPESIMNILKKMTMFKDLLGDAAQIAEFMLILAAIGFAVYEFTTRYIANNYDVAATLGDLISSIFLTFIEAVGDSIVSLFTKIGNGITSAIL